MDAMDTDTARGIADDFFAEYARDLLARDAPAIAARYAVPGLILFPGQSVPVASQEQTEQFFAGAFDQYEGIRETTPDISVLVATVHSIWADVTWRHDTGATERIVYQLVDTDDGWRIAVLTPIVD